MYFNKLKGENYNQLVAQRLNTLTGIECISTIVFVLLLAFGIYRMS